MNTLLIIILGGTKWLSNLPMVTQVSRGRERKLVRWACALLFPTFCGFFSVRAFGSCPFGSLPLPSINNSAGQPALRHLSSNYKVGFSVFNQDLWPTQSHIQLKRQV